MNHCFRNIVIVATWFLVALQADASSPNIVLIYSDDHGWADLGAQRVDPDIRTPNLDQLAKDGVRFTRGYVSAPQCVPSRAGVITGRYQQRFGVEDNNHGPLPLRERTIAEQLKSAGYVSGWVGKCHLDIAGEKGTQKSDRLQRDHMPHHQGFDEYFRGEMKQYYASHDLRGVAFSDAPHVVSDNRFRVVVQTEAALSFLDRRAKAPETPWFLYLAWYAPHVPLESPEPWFSRTPDSLPLPRRQALAMIAAMDDGLGRLREKLKQMGVERDTLIFFIGDNGAPLGTVWDGSLNKPLVGQKGMLAEGGIRTPFVAAWPGTWPAGVVYDQPVINLDVAATAVAAAGLPVDPSLDGVNLTPYVTGKNHEAPHSHLFWRWGSQSAILEMPYKLIKLGSHPPLLFDVTTPEGENIDRNLAAKHPAIVQRLEQRLQAWAADLQPPGLVTEPSAFSRRHEQLFAEHRVISGTVASESPMPTSSPSTTPSPKAAAKDDRFQGWIARNGTLALNNDALKLTAADNLPKNARPFLTHSSLDLAGPVTVIVRFRSADSGEGPATITWRTKKDSFADHQTVRLPWSSGSEWQELRATLDEKAQIIHLRVNPPRGARAVEFQSITLIDRSGKRREFQFSKK